MRILLAILAAALAAAQIPQQRNEPTPERRARRSLGEGGLSQEQNEPKPARLTGTVTSTTGDPIPRAIIRLQVRNLAGQSLTAAANDSGSFTIEPVEPGTYMLMAQHTGYVAGRYGARTPTDLCFKYDLDAWGKDKSIKSV